MTTPPLVESETFLDGDDRDFKKRLAAAIGIRAKFIKASDLPGMNAAGSRMQDRIGAGLSVKLDRASDVRRPVSDCATALFVTVQ